MVKELERVASDYVTKSLATVRVPPSSQTNGPEGGGKVVLNVNNINWAKISSITDFLNDSVPNKIPNDNAIKHQSEVMVNNQRENAN